MNDMMNARKNDISRYMATITSHVLVNCYKEIITWKDTGLLPDESCLRDVGRQMIQFYGDSRNFDLRYTEDAVLEELGRRFVNLYDSGKIY